MDRIAVVARFSAPVKSGSGVHPVSCTMGTGSLSPVSSGRGVALTTHNHLKAEVKERRELYFYSPVGLHDLFWGEFCLCTPYLHISVQHLFFKCLTLRMEGLESLETYVAIFQKKTRNICIVIGLFLCNTDFGFFRSFSRHGPRFFCVYVYQLQIAHCSCNCSS